MIQMQCQKLAKQNIKANQRTALSIMSAILIAATFFMYLMYSYSELLESESATGNF